MIIFYIFKNVCDFYHNIVIFLIIPLLILSNCFCEDCNRIRLTPDGFLKQCLHFDYGVDLKSKLRENITDEELRKIIKDNIYDKPEKHLFLEKSTHKEIKFMNQIGG